MTLHADGVSASDIDDHRKAQRAAVKAHGSQAPPADETVHTTANHPWLTMDRGWVLAGDLRLGERVVRLDGTTATVTALAVRPGVTDYYNLTVSQLHTYAVGAGQFVVHNCPSGDGSGGSAASGANKPTIKVKDLNPIHSPSTSGVRPDLERLTDDELMQSVTQPKNGRYIQINTRTGGIMDGNGRAYELLRRAADPASWITPDTPDTLVPYVPYVPWSPPDLP